MEGITLRTWLKDIRAKKELTQQEVANAANVDVTMISKIELGERRPSVEVAKKSPQSWALIGHAFSRTRTN